MPAYAGAVFRDLVRELTGTASKVENPLARGRREQLHEALTNVPHAPGKPTAILAHTIKGKGVSFMEDKLEWHYKSPDAVQLGHALEELGICA